MVLEYLIFLALKVRALRWRKRERKKRRRRKKEEEKKKEEGRSEEEENPGLEFMFGNFLFMFGTLVWSFCMDLLVRKLP